LGIWKYLSLEIFINSFLRLNIVNPAGVETEFQMYICTTLSVLQHQAWN